MLGHQRPVWLGRLNWEAVTSFMLVASCLCSGCGDYSLGSSDEKLAKYVKSGFRTDIHPRLFISRTSLWGPSRLEALADRMGYEYAEYKNKMGGPQVDVNTDGTRLSLSRIDAEVVFRSPSTDEAKGDKPPDAPTRFDVRGGTQYAYTPWKKMKRKEPIVIFDPTDPDKPLATLNADIGGYLNLSVYASKERVYLLGGRGNNRMRCWEFSREGKSLKLDWEYDVNIPTRYGEFRILDFDAQTEALLIEMPWDMPNSMLVLFRRWTCLYDMKSGKFEELGYLPAGHYKGFLDPEIFDHALKNLPPRGAAASSQ